MQARITVPLRIIVGIVVMTSVALLLLLSNPPWETAGSATAFYSALAFLAVTMTATALSAGKVDPSPSYRIFVAGTAYASIIFAGAAIFYIFMENLQPSIPAAHSTPAGVFLNLVAFVTTGILMLASTVLKGTQLGEGSLWYRGFTVPLIALLCGGVFAISMYLSRQAIDAGVFVLAGGILGVTAVLSYVAAGIITVRDRHKPSWNDSHRMAAAFLLLAAASLTHTLILPSPSSIWVISMILMGAAFILAIMAINYPFLTNIGVEKGMAYVSSASTAMIAILPFIVTHLFEALVGVDNQVVDVGATMVIHFGASILAGATAYSLFVLSRQHPTPYHSAIVILLIAWSIAEGWIAATRILPLYGERYESLVPYLVGSIVSVIALAVAARRTLRPRPVKLRQTAKWSYGLAVLTILSLLSAGEYLRSLSSESWPMMLGYPLGVAIMLALSYVSLFYLLSFLTGLTAISGGKLSADAIGAAAVSLWVVVVILKSNFSDWTPGWWLAEILMLCATASFPLLLLLLYLRQSIQRENLTYRLTHYSSLMSSEIMKLHGSASDSLATMSTDSTMSEAKLDSLSHALADISRADDLTRCMESLIVGPPFTQEQLETLDLVESINAGYSRMDAWMTGISVPIQTNRKTGECLVRANSLTADLFQSLLSGVVQRIGEPQSVTATIDRIGKDQPAMWRTRLAVILRAGDADRKQELFARYTQGNFTAAVEFAYAKRIATLLGGRLLHESSLSDDQVLTVVFIVDLPAAPAT